MQLSEEFTSALADLNEAVSTDPCRLEDVLGEFSEPSPGYSIPASGDCFEGDEILCVVRRYKRGTAAMGLSGEKVLAGYEVLTGTVGRVSSFPTDANSRFTIHFEDGRHRFFHFQELFAVGVWRKPWFNEDRRMMAIDRKCGTGFAATMRPFEPQQTEKKLSHRMS